MWLLVYFLISLRICFGEVVSGVIRIDSTSYKLDADSCVSTAVFPGWHRINLEIYGYKDIDTTISIGKKDTLLLLSPPLYTVDTVVSSPTTSIRSFMTVDNEEFSRQPMPLVQDPVLFIKTMPFVLTGDEMSTKDLDYTAALGTPAENMLSIEGMPVAALPIYPHSLIPLPIINRINFYLLDIPNEIGWTISSHIDVKLPSGGNGKYLYFDPLGTASFSYSGNMKSGGIQFYTLTPFILLFSKGSSRISHFDAYYKRIYGKYLFTTFGLGEMVDIRDEYEPENTRIMDFGTKISTGDLTSYISASFYRYSVKLEDIYENFVTLGSILKWKFLNWRLNLVREYVKNITKIELGNGSDILESVYERWAVVGRAWTSFKFRSIVITPLADAIFQRVFVNDQKSARPIRVYPGLKLHFVGALNLSFGTSNQFFKIFKKDKDVPGRHDIRKRTFYVLLGINRENATFMTFFRKNITDSLYGFGFYGKLVRRVGRNSGIAVSLWGMYSKNPAHDYGINTDLILTRRWGKSIYFLTRIVNRYPIYLISGKKEPNYFRLDLMFLCEITIRSHPVTVYAGIYNLFSDKHKAYDIEYPIPMLSFRIKL